MQLQREIEEHIHWLGEFGKDDTGGISRFLYSDSWLKAQKALKTLFESEGFTTAFDEVGNLFARLPGSQYTDETILTGSHVDTVRNGGHYDGQLGVIAGYLALKSLKQNYGQPVRNIEVVAMAEEEGSRFPYSLWGSKNIAGVAKPGDVKDAWDHDGISFQDAMRGAGFDFKDDPAKIRKDLKAFIELHIEQGSVLETEQLPIGIVQHIAGQRRFTITISGEANHAGTTPMHYRKDAVNAAARMIHAINDKALSYGDPLVATVGRIEAQPGTSNVVPGKAEFTLDTRHTDKTELAAFTEDVTAILRDIASQLDVGIDIDMWMDEDPVPMDENVVNTIQRQCDQHQLDYKLMHSGAGHDSQILAQMVPTAMLFVPSRAGISHSPEEYTESKDLAEGVKALTSALYEMGYSK